MRLTDRIIEAGPYAPGDVLPPELVREVFKTGELNNLREELLAARKASEVRGRFAIDAFVTADLGIVTQLECRRCDYVAEIKTRIGIAELNRRAAEHAEVCR